MKLRLLGLGICGSLLALTVLGILLTSLRPFTRYSDGVLQLCLLMAAVATVRLWLHLVVACRAGWVGLPIAPRSALVRAVVLAACGASVVAMAPAYAETPPERPESPAFALDGLPLPEVPTQPTRAETQTPPERESRPTPPAPTQTSPRVENDAPLESTAPSPPRSYVVQPGDSLWALARRFVPDASDSQILRIIAAWHADNREVIGPDPSLIFPGQHLDLSTGATS